MVGPHWLSDGISQSHHYVGVFCIKVTCGDLCGGIVVDALSIHQVLPVGHVRAFPPQVNA